MPPNFFPYGARVNAFAYTEALNTVVRPCITAIARGRLHLFQHDFAAFATGHTPQEWMAETLHDHVTPNMWPPSSSDINPMDYSVRGLAGRGSNKRAHNTIAVLREAVVNAMANISKVRPTIVCSQSRQSVEVVSGADDNFFE